ncbi:InlB B-repeat-containing protein [Bacillus toyonensis]|uniref:InlB B-repeat-containing protein n=1 Tax=Bacillus toyonensis TaxID=155322 RepID=UPI00211D4679|nr:InlB B-repeat-containing protein [Bacillus toyonensis]
MLEENNDVVEITVITSDKEIDLKKPKVANGKMLSYWSIEMKNEKLLIKPVLTTKEEFSVKFYVKDTGGNLIENHGQIKEIVKSATNGTKLKDILPAVKPDHHYKFKGWFAMVDKGDGKKVEEKLEDIDDIKITDPTGEYYAKFFSDFNNNGIDDKTEEITVNFVTNIEEQIDPVKLNVGQTIKAPKLSNKHNIFIDWYTNPELTNKFANDNLKGSMTLYAKWEGAEKVITESEKKPITDKDVSDQIEKILNGRFKELKENPIITEQSNETTNDVQNRGTNETTEKPKGRNNDKGTATNNDPKSDTHNTKDHIKGNSSTVISSPNNRWGSSPQNETNLKDNVASNSNKINTYTEKKYIFNNSNVGEKYMVKFYDEDGAFVSSLTLPYGRTLKLLDENENLHEEYAVRQDTTINLNTKKYVTKDSIFLGLDTRTVIVNASEITETYPKITKKDNSRPLNKYGEHDDPKKNSGDKSDIIILSVCAVFCIILGTFLYLKKRKNKPLFIKRW